ncbi:MAG TPA: hypothetical protein VGG99_18220 [Acetobacteraceae bacterium]
MTDAGLVIVAAFPASSTIRAGLRSWLSLGLAIVLWDQQATDTDRR